MQGPKPDILQSCYNSCLDTTLEYGLSSVAFCMISCGVFGYPAEDATRTALLVNTQRTLDFAIRLSLVPTRACAAAITVSGIWDQMI